MIMASQCIFCKYFLAVYVMCSHKFSRHRYASRQNDSSVREVILTVRRFFFFFLFSSPPIDTHALCLCIWWSAVPHRRAPPSANVRNCFHWDLYFSFLLLSQKRAWGLWTVVLCSKLSQNYRSLFPVRCVQSLLWGEDSSQVSVKRSRPLSLLHRRRKKRHFCLLYLSSHTCDNGDFRRYFSKWPQFTILVINLNNNFVFSKKHYINIC